MFHSVVYSLSVATERSFQIKLMEVPVCDEWSPPPVTAIQLQL